jgi:poly-gamma-glutamate synthesis protein (capsule biosynthesis protein)
MDWGVAGLEETLSCLQSGGIETVGAGQDLEAARAPAVISLPGDRRALVYAYGATSSGIPPRWAADRGRPGISLLEDLSSGTVDCITDDIEANRRSGDVVIVSLHWGPNWGYAVPDARIRFAHALIDSGRVDVVHGHSSHHPIGVERYREGLVLYGCGDFLNDYEGISGHESFRSDLVLLYRITFRNDLPEPALRMTPLQIRRMRLNRAAREDVEWLATALTRASARFGTRINVDEHDEFVV